ncbi:MAG: hypothetical protein AAFY41_01775 [Bacteroidota bacterium]
MLKNSEMIFDTSYTDKETTRKINKAVGLPFSWKQRIKMGGIGSRRMTIHDISDEYKSYVNLDHYFSTANLEMRPQGIIVHFRQKLHAYSWVMPFETIRCTFDGFLRLESEGKYIQFNEPKNEKFIAKMLEIVESR